MLHSDGGPGPVEEFRCGDYLTDGQRLFQIVSKFSTVAEHVLAG